MYCVLVMALPLQIKITRTGEQPNNGWKQDLEIPCFERFAGNRLARIVYPLPPLRLPLPLVSCLV